MSEQKYFDTIAEGYGTLDTGTTPVRRFSEVYTLLRRLPPVLGRSVLELACSDGFFSRLIKSKGAASLIAVDLSPQMIALARAHEAAEPLGIDYRAAYGKTKRINGPAEDGAKLTVTWVVPDAQGRPEHLAFDCRYFTREALEWALAGAGFVDIRIHRPEVSPEGLETFGEQYWARFLENPLLVFIEASKP